MKKLSLLIFDMDGLLVDTEIFYKRGWLVSTKKLGVNLSEDVVNSWVGKSVDYTANYLENLTGSKEKVQEIRKEREKYFYYMLESGEINLKKGAKELLLYLKKMNIKTALASSTVSKRGMDILEYFDIKNLFDNLTFGDDVENLKPAPDLYNSAFEKSKLTDKREVIVIEDSLTGAKAAYNANFDCIIVPDNNFHKSKFKNVEDNVIAQFEDLDLVREYIKNIIN